MKDILEKYWVEYLRYWKKFTNKPQEPPTVDGFWAWYCQNVLDKPSDAQPSLGGDFAYEQV